MKGHKSVFSNQVQIVHYRQVQEKILSKDYTKRVAVQNNIRVSYKK